MAKKFTKNSEYLLTELCRKHSDWLKRIMWRQHPISENYTTWDLLLGLIVLYCNRTSIVLVFKQNPSFCFVNKKRYLNILPKRERHHPTNIVSRAQKSMGDQFLCKYSFIVVTNGKIFVNYMSFQLEVLVPTNSNEHFLVLICLVQTYDLFKIWSC